MSQQPAHAKTRSGMFRAPDGGSYAVAFALVCSLFLLISVFVAELYASNQGVGFLITQAGTTYNTPLMLMGILLFTIAGMALSRGLSFIEERYLSRFREQ